MNKRPFYYPVGHSLNRLALAILLTISTLFTHSLFAQTCDSTFIKRIGSYGMTEQGRKIVPLQDGNLLIGGNKDNASLLLKITPQGEVIWERVFDLSPTADYFYEMIIDSEGMLVLVGRYAMNSNTVSFIMRYDYQNDMVLWTVKIPDPSSVLLDGILEKTDGNYIAFGTTNYYKLIIEVDKTDGSLKWDRSYNTGNPDAFRDAILIDSAIYTANIQRYGTVLSKTRPGVSKLNLDGSQVWTRNYLKSLSAVATIHATNIASVNDTLAILGYGNLTYVEPYPYKIQFFTTDLDGNLHWAKQYDLPGNYQYSKDLIALPDGYLLLAEITQYFATELLVMKIDKEGQKVWAKTIGGPYHESAWSFAVMGEYLVIVGNTKSFDEEGDIILCKIALDGSAVGDECTIVADAVINTTNIASPYSGQHLMQPKTYNYTLTTETLASSISPASPNTDMPGCGCIPYLCNILIENPGFENGLTGWNITGEVAISPDAPTGTKAVEICGLDDGSVGQIYPAQQGESFTASVWGKITDPDYAAAINLRFLDGSFTPLTAGEDRQLIKSHVYEQYFMKATAPPGTAYVHFLAWKERDNCAYFDDVRLCKDGDPIFFPDLTVEGLSIPNNPVLQGSSLSVEYTISNIGTATTSIGFNVDFYISTSNTLDQNSILLASYTQQPYAIGATANLTSNPILPNSLQPGNYYLIAIVDKSQTIIELDEGNNKISFPFSVDAPGLCDGTITLTSQAEVDAFPNCPTINGDLVISGNDITDLTLLSTLVEITGALAIQNNASLATLAGLENVMQANILIVQNNPLLNSLSPLSNLTKASMTTLAIENNDQLVSLTGLEGISGVGQIRINYNDNLLNLDGLQNLSTITGQFLISGNANLNNINALSQISAVGSDLLVLNNDKLGNLSGLSQLANIGRDLIVVGANALVNLDGLQNLIAVGEELVFQDNALLENLDGLASLTSTQSLIVQDNANLAACCAVFPLLNAGTISGSITIENNLPGCNSEQEIEDTCTPVGSYIDLELHLAQPNESPAQWTSYATTATLTNNGDAPATGIQVSFAKPAGVVYTGGNEYTASQGSFNPNGNEVWTVSSLAPGQSATLTVNYFLLQNTLPTAYAQVTAANEDDVDSTPNNGTPPSVNEDDEASTAPPTNGPIICAGSVILESQAEVDAFQGCEIIEGQLTIRSPFGINGASSDITDLTPLLSITKVTGVIVIQNNDSLFNLTGLDNITSSNGIVVQSCENINSIQALSGISGEVNVIKISGNPSLTNIDGLEGITKTHNTAEIDNNSTLQNLNGLSGLVEVNDVHLFIHTNPLLTDIQGLSNLTHINTDLIIGNCDGLENLNGLHNLVYAKSFILAGNDLLTDVSAVTSLTDVDITFFVANNPLLSDCCIFTDLLNNNNIVGITIENNAPGCNSEQDIEASCGPVICTGDVILESQAEVDAFAGCTKIDGILIIEGTDIVDLSPLMPLQEVTGQISIQDCPNLTSLDGLNNLELVPAFVLSRNDDLADISALSKIGGNLTYLSITENHQLYDLMGLHGVTHLDYLLLQDNNSLATLQGLNNLTHIGNDFKIIGNQIFDSFYALDKLVSIGGDFQVTANPNLRNFYRMLDLESIGGSFLVSLNPKLEDFTGLSGLLTADKFSVVSCDGLLSLSGINQGFTTNEILVHSNGMLSDCCFLNYMLKNNIAATVDIYDNALGCNNNQEIMDGCGPVICTGVIQLNSQAQVNAFNCTEIINGILVISGSDIVDLTPLSVLTNVTHEINITNNNSLTSLAGLENTQGTKRLYIRNNPLLEDISALQSLSGDFQEIIVSNNGQLLSLSGLEGVIKVGILEILYNANLLTINGLPNLTETTNLLIVGNSSLQNVDGLDALKVVKNNFFIINNPALANLHGLNSLTNVNLQFDLKYLPMLSNFNGLEKLTTVGVFIINDNAILENINALDSSFSNAIYEINITNNPMLATCCGLFDYLQNPQSSFSQEYFSNNLPGCNSKQEIIDACGISVCSGDVILESQAEVDAFQGCEIIEGSLQIRSPFGTNGASSDITDLSNLLSLTKVTGTIGIDNCDELYNLHGLENVTSSNGIAVNNCDKINDLSALSGISGEASVVYIYGNSSLTNIDGLEGITVLHNSLSIESNPVLQNVDGLANLKEVNYAHFTIIDNPSLENIHGLGNLETVNTTLFIQRCDALGSLDGLNKLTTTVRLVVSGNDMLTDISALSSLTNVENEFLIVDNPLLSDCCILTDLLNSSAIGGPISIENNAPGCNSEQDIETSCGPVICTGDVILESQAEVDAFPGCEIIEGQLVIEGGDISDLTPLSSLKEIRKVLVIRNNSNLLTLNGLNNLTTIGGLAVVNNPLLKNLLPLSNVNSDDLSPLVFQKNKAMIDLKGLEGITGVQYLSISENSNLTTLEGLNNLAIGKSDFLVSQNPALENLNGLNSLHTTKDVTGIHNNDVLADISALSQLNSVFVLAINSNPSLTNLSGLENLSDVWTIAITGNDALENLDAFSSLTAITGDLTIIDNPALSDCCGIQPLLNGGGIAGNILIENNPFACGSGFDIINNCGPSGVDLELSMSQPNAAPAQWTTYPVTLTLSNKGDSPATGIVVHFPKPDGVVYAGGNEFSTSQGTFNPFGNQEWVVGKLKEGGTVTLTVNYFLLQSGAPVAYAQVSAVNEEDIDSSPNNGTPPSVNEDDEANSVDPFVSSACSGDIVLKSQAEVNAFGNCEIIDGNLMIVGDDIIDLTPLSSLKEVKGNLNIWNNGNLTNLEGLNNLFSVGGLTLRSNPHLENLLPLSNLSGDKLAHLVISKNKELLDLKGLEGITGLEQLFIEGNTYLTTLEGLDNLVVAEGNITIWRNSSLLNLNALANLQSVGAAFTIEQNDKLSDLSALANLGPCRDLHVLTNASLLDLSGLENLSGLRDLTIAQNNGLKNLDAFSSLTSISGELTVRGNPALTDCCGIQPLLSGGNIGGPINIYLNPFACNNEQNILDNCTATVCTGDVILESQAEVDAFSGCEIIDGNLYIHSPNGVTGASSDITDLSPLLGLTQINGYLSIINNKELVDLHGLENLTSVFYLQIRSCDNLNSIQALSGISGELGSLVLWDNPSLSYMDGLNGITGVSGVLSLLRNNAFKNLDALSNLTYVNLDLTIDQHSSLTDIQGLSNLANIGHNLKISNCNVLQNLNGLNNITSLNSLTLSGNQSLQDVSGLNTLTNIDDEIQVKNNPMLSDCCIFDDLLKSNSIGGTITFENNAPGCNSEQDIESSCGPVICTGDVILESQAEVDAFPGCEIIEGSLIIQGPSGSTSVSSDIHDLSPLLSLTEVHGSVKSVNNDSLYDLHGLNALTSVGDGLAIVECANLTSIQALSGISGELGNISILGNASLVNLDGLEGINKVKRNLSVENNAALQNLNGLSNVDSVSTSGNFFPLFIFRNPSLENIQGLQGLEHIGGPMVIVGCDTLENLNGLENLKTVGGFFVLAENYQLYDASALGNLLSVGGSFTVTGNPLLSDCCIFTDLINNNGISGSIDIQSNAPGCNSEQDIESSCGPVTCTGDVILESQAEVDAFQGCEVIEGNLQIRPPLFSGLVTDIHSLLPLQSIKEVTGNIVIENNEQLLSLEGLNNITKARGLAIVNCDSLNDIRALSSLSGELYYITIMDNQVLTQIDGLEGITSVPTNISIDENEALQNVDGFSNLTSVGTNTGAIHLGKNPNLTSLHGFGNIIQMAADFQVVECVSLQNLDGLQNLQQIGGLVLVDNTQLKDVTALQGLTSVLNLFIIQRNPVLEDCCTFYDLIVNNGIGGVIGIQDNPSFCSSEAEIINHCQPQGIDLELSMTTTILNPAIYTSSLITLTLSNIGTESATGVKVSFPKPDGTVYTGGNEWTATQGVFNPFTNEEWTVGDLPAGGSVTLTVSYFLLTANTLSPYAQVTAHNETDSDSSPGNGTPPTVNEDDEATILLNGFTGNGGGISLKNHNERFRLIFDNIFPNPAKYLITMDIFSRLDQTVLLDFYDVTGRSIHRMEVILEEGQNKVELNVSEWRSGTYNVIGRGDGLPAYGRFLKIWEE